MGNLQLALFLCSMATVIHFVVDDIDAYGRKTSADIKPLNILVQGMLALIFTVYVAGCGMTALGYIVLCLVGAIVLANMAWAVSLILKERNGGSRV